jgi:hypothetical protein
MTLKMKFSRTTTHTRSLVEEVGIVDSFEHFFFSMGKRLKVTMRREKNNNKKNKFTQKKENDNI